MDKNDICTHKVSKVNRCYHFTPLYMGLSCEKKERAHPILEGLCQLRISEASRKSQMLCRNGEKLNGLSFYLKAAIPLLASAICRLSECIGLAAIVTRDTTLMIE